MKNLVRYQIDSDSYITVESDEPSSGTRRATARGNALEQAKEKFEDVIGQIKPVTSLIIKTLNDLADSPDEATIEFGVKLNTNSGVVIASAGVEANFVFKLTWKRRPNGAVI